MIFHDNRPPAENQTILIMECLTLFVIFENAGKFESVVRYKL